MTRLAELIVNGLASGAVYALIALGFVVIYKATEVVNFAHASLLLTGGYVIAVSHERFGFWLAVLLGVLAAGALAALVEFAIVRRARARDHRTIAIATIGIDIVLIAELSRRIGVDVLSLGDPWGDRLVHIGPATFPLSRIAALVIASLLIALFLLAFKYTSWGVAMRAAAEDGETATLMGVRLGRVSLGAWAVAGALAAVAAVFLTAFPTPGLDRTSAAIAIKAFPAAILGGLDSTTGALVGGLLVGLTEALCVGYQEELSVFGRGFGNIAPYLVMIAILLWRPSGLFGTKEVTRV